MKDYTFTAAEMIVIREALADYKQHIRPDANSTAARVANYQICSGLHAQFKDDIRLAK